jgi:protein disulfide-isomerase A6
MLKYFGCALLVLTSLVQLSSCLYSPSDDVIQLTADTFKGKVIDSNDLWLVEFYAPWCGHCKNLAPEWAKAAKALKGIVKLGAVDMDAHPSVGSPYQIQGFPTIKVFGGNKQKPSDYQGGRTAQAIVDEALSQVRNIVKERMGGGGGGSSGSSGSKSSGGSGKF